MEPNNLSQATPLPPPRAQRRPQPPCFIRRSEHEHLVLPLHTVPQLFINPPHLPRVLVDVQQELTPRRDDTQFRLRILPTLGDPQLLPNGNEMKILAWNCRGIASANFVCATRSLVDRHQPDMLILMNTRHLEDRVDSSSDAIFRQLSFSSSFVAKTLGLPGGYWILYRNESLIISNSIYSMRFVHLEAMLLPQLPPIVQDPHELIG